MSNGFSDKEMIQLVLDGQSGMNEKLNDLVVKINTVVQHGCAHRPDDIRRTENLERWLNRALAGMIGSLGVIVLMLVKIIFVK